MCQFLAGQIFILAIGYSDKLVGQYPANVSFQCVFVLMLAIIINVII
jgi:hypothetical protein